jgi:hypothetical protein
MRALFRQYFDCRGLGSRAQMGQASADACRRFERIPGLTSGINSVTARKRDWRNSNETTIFPDLNSK